MLRAVLQTLDRLRPTQTLPRAAQPERKYRVRVLTTRYMQAPLVVEAVAAGDRPQMAIDLVSGRVRSQGIVRANGRRVDPWSITSVNLIDLVEVPEETPVDVAVGARPWPLREWQRSGVTVAKPVRTMVPARLIFAGVVT